MSSQTSQLKNGEFLESNSVYLSEPLASYSGKRRYRNAQGQMVHEIMNVELSRETRLETEAQLNQNFNDFS
jgi:hypothetical protein